MKRDGLNGLKRGPHRCLKTRGHPARAKAESCAASELVLRGVWIDPDQLGGVFRTELYGASWSGQPSLMWMWASVWNLAIFVCIVVAAILLCDVYPKWFISAREHRTLDPGPRSETSQAKQAAVGRMWGCLQADPSAKEGNIVSHYKHGTRMDHFVLSPATP